MAVIGLVSPGQMGSGIAACAQKLGHEIIWASDGRSNRTVERADQYGFRDVGVFQCLVKEADHILCCGAGHGRTKHWVVETIEDIAVEGFQGIYCDTNTKHDGLRDEVKALAETHDIDYVDGAIFGNPPVHSEIDCRGYLKGERAEEFAELFNDPAGPFNWIPIDGDPQMLKLAFSAYLSQAYAGVVLANRFARAHGVEEHLFYELKNGYPLDLSMDGDRMGLFAGW